MKTFGISVIVSAVLLGALFLYCKRKFNYWKNKGVQHKKTIFPFGNFLDLLLFNDSPTSYFVKLYNDYEAPYIGFYALTTPYLLIKDPEIIKTILIKEFNVFSNRCVYANKKIDPVISNSLLAIRGPQWKELRTKLSSAFKPGKIKMMTTLMLECGKNLETYLFSNLSENIEMKELAAKYTTDVIASCAFGINANPFEEESDFRYYGRTIFPTTTFAALKAMTYVFAPIFVKIFKYAFMDKKSTLFFRKVFEQTLKTRKSRQVKKDDLADILNEIKQAENGTFKFDDDVVLAQAVIFFAVGHETTSSTISFTLHELSLNPDIQQTLREEILREIEKHGGVTYEAIQNMKYLHMVVSETLRKYPITPIINRQAMEDYKLKETGLLIEKGTVILISQKGLHWDPRYFPNPEKYDPERFNEINKQKIPNYVYLPFSKGPRSCIGERFALLSSKLGIIHVLKNVIVEKNSKTIEPIVFGRSPIIKPKHGINLTCKKL